MPFEPIDDVEHDRRRGERDGEREGAAAEEVQREVAERAVRAEPRVEDEHAEDVRQRAFVDDELAHAIRQSGRAGNRHRAADHRERDRRQHGRRNRHAERPRAEPGHSRERHAEAERCGRARRCDEAGAPARDGEIERAFEDDQDEAQRAEDRDDRLDPFQVEARGIERVPQHDAGHDQQHDGRQLEPAPDDVDEIGEQQQPGRREDRRLGHGRYLTGSGSCRRRAGRPEAARRPAESRSTTRPAGAFRQARASRARCRPSPPRRSRRPPRRGSRHRCRS